VRVSKNEELTETVELADIRECEKRGSEYTTMASNWRAWHNCEKNQWSAE
jgi:hypothetical protein